VAFNDLSSYEIQKAYISIRNFDMITAPIKNSSIPMDLSLNDIVIKSNAIEAFCQLLKVT
jgi:hypothetical protein